MNEAFEALPAHPDHRPWPRRDVDEAMWRALAQQLAAGETTLLGLWGETGIVHMALLDGKNAVAVASLACAEGRFPSVARHHPPASRLERTIRDLHGLEAVGAPDPRPWLDHGRWPTRPNSSAYAFLPSLGQGLHQIPVGPVHAGIIEPGHFRFTACGEAVVRLEERLGYTHKGVESLMAGATLDRAGFLAARLSGDSTVACSLSFSRAIESALGFEPPLRVNWVRALMAELERLANHFGDIGGVCNDAAFALMLAHCSVLRERVLRACDVCFGHRMMMDVIIPGGLRADLDPEAPAVLRDLVATLRAKFPPLIELYENTASLQDRTVNTGVLSATLARQYGCGGFVGRASGRGFDARRDLAYAPYDLLKFDVPTLAEGDVNARVWLRIREVEQSLGLIDQILAALPPGPFFVEPPAGGGEGLALVEGFRGDILTWARLAPDGKIDRCHMRDPSWFQWPLIEAAIEGNIVADFPLLNKSFNCSYSGHDL
jgi:Ni,Fe-hydrogenase III large subunit